MDQQVVSIGLDDLRKIVRQEVENAVASHDQKKKLLSTEEVCSLFHISKVTLWRWRRDKKIAPCETVGNRYLFRANDVEKLLG